LISNFNQSDKKIGFWIITVSYHGHIDVFNYLFSLYSGDVSELLSTALCNACRLNHLKLVEHIFNIGSSLNITFSLNTALLFTSNKLILDIIILKAKQSNIILDFDKALCRVCSNGHQYLIDYFLALGAKSINQAIHDCIKVFNFLTFKYLLETGSSFKLRYPDIILPTKDDLNEMLYLAVLYYQLDMVKYLITQGADDITKALNLAYQHNYHGIIDYLNTLS